MAAKYPRTQLRVEEVALALLGVFVLLVGLDSFLGVGQPRALFAFAFFAVVPGMLLLTVVGYGPRAELPWLLYTVGTSLLIIMAVGFLLNLALPRLGVEYPFRAVQIGVAHTFVIVGLALAIRVLEPAGRSITVPDRDAQSAWLSRWFRPTTLALLLLPLLAILSVAWLNRTGGNGPLLALLLVLAVVPIAVALNVIARRWLGLSVWAVGMSLLFHDSLWQFTFFSGKANIINSWQVGRWAVTAESAEGAVTSALLPNVTLSPTFAHMADIHILTQVEVLNPIIVSLIPVASYVIFRRIFDPSDAALGALLMTFIHPFYFQLPALGRAATPVLFLVLTAAAITDTDLDPVLRKGLAIGFVAALATSHYGGSYFAMVAILTAVVLLVGTRLLDAVVLKLFRPNLAVRSDGGERDRNWTSIPSTSSYTLSATFALLYFVIVFGWFLYSRGGLRLERFFERINVALTDFLTGAATPSGGTASRLTRDYGTASIELARWVYIFIAMLTAVGVLYLFVQRFAGTRWRNHEVFDEYFVLAAATLGTFSLTFFASGIWGGGRPMAIAFSIIALLAVAGAYAVITAPWKLYRRLVSSRDTSLTDRHRMAVRSFFAVILAVFVVLNTGAAAALVLGGGAPSSVPLQPEIEDRAAESPTEHGTVHFEQDLSMLVWLNTYADPDTGVIGDGRTRQRNNDIYGPQIAAGVEAGERQSFGWNPDLFAVVGHQGESYAVLPSYSVNLNVAEVGSGYTGAREFGDISEVNERLSNELKIYTNGDSEIYRTVKK